MEKVSRGGESGNRMRGKCRTTTQKPLHYLGCSRGRVFQCTDCSSDDRNYPLDDQRRSEDQTTRSFDRQAGGVKIIFPAALASSNPSLKPWHTARMPKAHFLLTWLYWDLRFGKLPAVRESVRGSHHGLPVCSSGSARFRRNVCCWCRSRASPRCTSTSRSGASP